MMSRLFPALALIALAASNAAAEGAGTTGAEFLKIGVGARALAMGRAAAAVADDATASYWNPAGLAFSGGGQAAAGFSALFKDQRQGFLALSGPLGSDSHWGLGAEYQRVGDIEKRAADTDAPDSTFAASDLSVGLSLARRLGSGASFGLTLKGIRASLDRFEETTGALDAGLRLGGPESTLSFGLTVQNLGPKLGPDKLPTLARVGLAWRPFGALTLAADVERWLESERSSLDAGAELRLGSRLALRGGWQSARKDDKLGGNAGLSGGLGLKLGGVSFDYAFLPFGDLGDTHRASLGLRF